MCVIIWRRGVWYIDDGGFFSGRCGLWHHQLLTCWMLLTVYTLPQLAVSAKLLCLLMVVICGAVPSFVRSVKLYSESSYKFVRINSSGHVYAVQNDNSDPYQNLSLKSVDYTGKLAIYSEKAQRYLCFNRHWRLVGMRLKLRKKNMLRCEFSETMDDRGYSLFHSAANSSYFIAFNRNGKPLRYNAKLDKGYEKGSRNFIKFNSYVDIPGHNARKSAGSQSRETQKPEVKHKRRHRKHHQERNSLL